MYVCMYVSGGVCLWGCLSVGVSVCGGVCLYVYMYVCMIVFVFACCIRSSRTKCNYLLPLTQVLCPVAKTLLLLLPTTTIRMLRFGCPVKHPAVYVCEYVYNYIYIYINIYVYI